jgi:ankyrin repeat protein
MAGIYRTANEILEETLMNNPSSLLRHRKLTHVLYINLLLLSANALGMNKPEKQLIYAAKVDDLKNLARLIAQGVSIEAKDDFGRTPLICAVICGSAAACKLLIANKASLEAVDNDGKTPLMRTTRFYKEAIRKPWLNSETISKGLINAEEAMGKVLIDAQLEPAMKKIAAIITILGIAKKRLIKLPCHMPYDIALIIVRKICELAPQNKRSVVDQIIKQINKVNATTA